MGPHVLVLNGSLRGPDGNTAWLLEEALRRLGDRGTSEVVHLTEVLDDLDGLLDRVRRANAFLVGTGVYWSSWGSPLQRFLEIMTPFENTDVFFGKPVGALVTMDSVGGAELCARLLGVFHSFGCVVPPCTSMVLSRLALEAATREPVGDDHDPNEDVWALDDVGIVVDNLVATVSGTPWQAWAFRPLIAPRGAYPGAGRLDLGSPRFLPPR